MKKFILFGLLCLFTISLTCNSLSANDKKANTVTAFYCVGNTPDHCIGYSNGGDMTIWIPGVRHCIQVKVEKLEIPDLPSGQVEYPNAFICDPLDNTKGIGIVNGVVRYNSTTNETLYYEVDGETDYTDFNAWQTAVSGSSAVQP